jgi:hypothetical protein
MIGAWLWLTGAALGQEVPEEVPDSAEPAAAAPEPAEAAEEPPASEVDVPAAPSREADMFGGPASAEPSPGPVGPLTNDERMLGGIGDEPTTNQDILERLTSRDDTLAIGGRMYLRLNGSLSEDGPVDEMPLSSPNLLDLFVDARPNDRVRAFAQARLAHDVTVQEGDTDVFGEAVEPSSITLDQLWMRFDVERAVYVTAGRQRIKWGAGRFWNPTDFMNQQVLDPLAVFDERTGVSLIKLHVPFQARNVDVYALANLEGASSPEEIGGAMRAEVLLGSTEVSLSGAVRKDQPLRLGADLSCPLWLFDVHVEGAVQHGVTTPTWEGTLDLETFQTFPTSTSREEDWIPQVVAGTEITLKISDEDSLSLGAEYFYNDAGYPSSELYIWLLAQGQYTPFYLGRHYGAAYAYVPGPDDVSFTAAVLSNLSDRSAIGRLDVRVLALTFLSVNAYGAYHFGDPGELHLGIDVPPIPGDPLLADGLHVAAPWVDVGLGAWVSF